MTFRPQLVVALLVGVLVAHTSAVAQTEADGYWPQWRGPLATGVAPDADPPTEWSESRNVRWRVAIPGHGSASPIVWNDKVFVLTAVPTGESGKSPMGFFARLRRRFMGGVGASDVQRFVILAIASAIAWSR